MPETGEHMVGPATLSPSLPYGSVSRAAAHCLGELKPDKGPVSAVNGNRIPSSSVLTNNTNSRSHR